MEKKGVSTNNSSPVYETCRKKLFFALFALFALFAFPSLFSNGATNQSPEFSMARQNPAAPIVPPVMTSPPGAAAGAQRAQGAQAGAALVASFDGLGVGFEGPQGAATLRNPSDNSLAVGPDHIVQTVNSRMAIFTKKGKRFEASGKPLYGPVNTNNVFKGFGGACERSKHGDAVV